MKLLSDKEKVKRLNGLSKVISKGNVTSLSDPRIKKYLKTNEGLKALVEIGAVFKSEEDFWLWDHKFKVNNKNANLLFETSRLIRRNGYKSKKAKKNPTVAKAVKEEVSQDKAPVSLQAILERLDSMSGKLDTNLKETGKLKLSSERQRAVMSNMQQDLSILFNPEITTDEEITT